MHNKIKNRLRVIGVALLLFAIVATFFPLLEKQAHYCLYCGHEQLEFHIIGLPIHWSRAEKNIYPDSIKIPDHKHKMIDFYSSRIWAFKAQQSSDEFGWTGRRLRDALTNGIQRNPESEEEIIAEYLSLDPYNEEQTKVFLTKYEQN